MPLLPILIMIVLGLLALAFVLYPFYRRAPAQVKAGDIAHNGHAPLASQQTLPGTATATDQERELAARAALRELDLDYHLGNIEEADYRALRERYLRRALVALKSRRSTANLPARDSDHELDEAIEARLRALKEHDADNHDEAE
jgi:flagellar basal body-associated protein FliL